MLLDLGSFAASIYMRGIKNVYLIPTTLLAMVDATVGGKNGVNYQNTKNLIGTIRNPKHIYLHLPYLRTQTKR
jgi:3-dehydroquinate synthetase